MSKILDIRPSPLAGRWYPADPQKLAESVDGYINAAQIPDIKGEILALISPHAGHLYSGPVAGYAFRAIQGKHPKLVVILSPFHQYHSGDILTTDHQAYQTPLGTIKVDEDSLQLVNLALQKKTGLGLTKIRADGEHAVEILLPFFQRALPEDFQILPLMIRRQDPDLMEILGDILADLIKSGEVLLAASTDLSHFHPAAEAQKLDQAIIQHIKTLDPEGLYRAQNSGKGSACGLGALAAVIRAAKSCGADSVYSLNYAHSGDITGDNNSVVGYTSAVLVRD